MQFDSFSAFLDMGGYAFYVWLSYGFTALILAGLIFNSLRSKSTLIKQIKSRLKREEKLRELAQRD